MIRVLAVTALILFVAGACFWLGRWSARRSDGELIEQLEAELDTRKITDLAELAYEPAEVTAWDLPPVTLEGLEELDIWTATLKASTDRFLIELGISPGSGPGARAGGLGADQVMLCGSQPADVP